MRLEDLLTVDDFLGLKQSPIMTRIVSIDYSFDLLQHGNIQAKVVNQYRGKYQANNSSEVQTALTYLL
jgi:hypothetical protein